MKRMFDCGMIKTAKKHSVTKADIGLALGILLCALFLFVFFQIFSKPGAYAEISCDGTVLAQISLAESEDKYYLIKVMPAQEDMTARKAETLEQVDTTVDAGNSQTAIQELTKEEWTAWQPPESGISEEESGDYNILVCQNGQVQMLASNCPDKICVHHNAIAKTGENIICLPHRVVIEIVGGEDKKLDGVVQ